MSYGHLFSFLCILTTIQDNQDKKSQDTHQLRPSITINYSDYLELVDWSGRAIRDDKARAIADNLPPILAELGIEQQGWLEYDQPLRATIFPGGRRDGQAETACPSAGTMLGKGQSMGKCVYKQTPLT